MNMKKFQIISVTAIFALILALPNLGRPDTSEGSEEEAKPGKGSSFGIIPIFGYAPETKFVGGAAGIYTFRPSEESRPSSALLSASFTQKKQYSLSLAPELYFRDGKYRIQSEGMGLLKSPELFYGIGNDTSDDAEESFTHQTVYFKVNFQRRVIEAMNVGVQYDFERTKMLEVEKGSLLEGGKIAGSDGGKNSGVGILLNWDSRDNVFSATKGGFHQISYVIYRDFLGSKYEFSQYELNLRQYIPLRSSHTLAFQGIFNSVTGDPPFHKLSLLGGEGMMRGHYLGRYRDRNMIAFQVEYRVLPVWWRFGLVGFLGVGDVSDDVKNFKLEDLKYSAGFGIRFQIMPEEGINLRIDQAFGEGAGGFRYINIGEAF
jgi:outer membrane protein assembly factor BamA